jgi:CHAT domain-containing protein/Tfp pilus assembly protein PilF
MVAGLAPGSSVLLARLRGRVGLRSACLSWFAALSCVALLALAAPAQLSKLVADEVPRPEVPPAIFHGLLTKTDPFDEVHKQCHCKVHEVSLQAGKAYSILLYSHEFRPQWRLENRQGRPLASARGMLEAWATFVPPQTGTYRLVATTSGADQEGLYWLELQRHADSAAARRWFMLERQAIAWHMQGVDASRQLQYGRALKFHRQGLEIRQKLYGEQDYPSGHLLVVISLTNVAVGLRQLGDNNRALTYYQKALQMCEKLYPERAYPRGQPFLATCLVNMGAIYQVQREYRRALSYYEQALQMRQRLYPERDYPRGHSHLALILNNLGTLYQSQGDYGQALTYQRQALQMYQQLYPEWDYPRGHPDLAMSLNNLGMLYQTVWKHDLALTHFRQASKMYQRLYPERDYPRGHHDLATSLSNLGLVYRSLGEDQLALTYFQHALHMRQQLYPMQDHPRGQADLAVSLSNLGAQFEALGDYGRARSYHEQALQMRQQLYPEKDYPRGHSSLVISLTNLGTLHYLQGEHGRALTYYQQALQMHQQLADAFIDGAAEAEALNYLGSLPLTHDAMLSVTRRLSTPPAETYRHLWASRALLVRLMEQRHVQLRATTDPQIRKLADQLTSVRERLLYRLFHPLKDGDQSADEVNRLTREKEKLERRLARELRLLQPTGPALTTPEQLCQALPEDAVFVDLVRYINFEQDPKTKNRKGPKRTASYLAFVLNHAGIERVELGPAEPIDTALHAWRQALISQTSDGTDSTLNPALQVRRHMWEKLVGKLPVGTRVIYLKPEADLTRMPWAALPGSAKNTILLEQYAFAVVPHGQFLLRMLTRKEPSPRSGSLLLAGAVNYNAAPDLPLSATAGSQDNARSLPLPAEGLTWPALPGTARELEHIIKLAKNRLPTRVLAGMQANTDEIKKQLPQVRCAHFATHGFFASKQFRSALQWDEKLFTKVNTDGGPGWRVAAAARSPLLLSGLVFAGANKPEAPDKGILVADSIVGLDLRQLDLAVLSACETGLGDVAGGEGVYGLQRAFHVAGCKNVVASLWQVNDDATAALMQLFYQGLWEEQLAPMDALRAAQLSIYYHPEKVKAWAAGERAVDLAKKYKKSTTQPVASTPAGPAARAPARLWAAFVLSGSGRRLPARAPASDKQN